MSLYTDDDVSAGLTALLGFDPHESTRDAWAASVRRLLDAVTPAIAARALREAADEFYIQHLTGDSAPVKVARAQDWFRNRADEIEGNH